MFIFSVWFCYKDSPGIGKGGGGAGIGKGGGEVERGATKVMHRPTNYFPISLSLFHTFNFFHH